MIVGSSSFLRLNFDVHLSSELNLYVVFCTSDINKDGPIQFRNLVRDVLCIPLLLGSIYQFSL